MQIQVWRATPLATDIKVDDIQRICFEFWGFTDENGMPWWHWSDNPRSDVPQLVLKQRAQFDIVLRALRSAKVRVNLTELGRPDPGAVPSSYPLYAVVIKLKSGHQKLFRYEDPQKTETSFGPAFRAVFRLLADDSARQVREAVARVRNTIKAVRGASGKEWRDPRDVQAIVAELLKVDRSFFEYDKYYTDPPPRVVKVQHGSGQFSIGFPVFDPQLIRRYRWL